jgi:hypothetical protein
MKLKIAQSVRHAEELANYIRENLLTKANAFSNGEINWNFVEADICIAAEQVDVSDPLPKLPVEVTNREQVDAAFDLIHRDRV